MQHGHWQTGGKAWGGLLGAFLYGYVALPRPTGHDCRVVTFLTLNARIPGRPLPVPGEGRVTPMHQPCYTAEKGRGGCGGGGGTQSQMCSG